MHTGIHFFSPHEVRPKNAVPETLGVWGRQAREFAELGLPIPPGIILDSALAPRVTRETVGKDLAAFLDACAGIIGKKPGDREKPLLLKIVVSPNLVISDYPVLHNVGLVKPALGGFAAPAVLRTVRDMLIVRERIRQREGKEREREQIAAALKNLGAVLREGGASPRLSPSEHMDMVAGYFPEGYFENAETQIFSALEDVSTLIALEDAGGGDTALMVQALAYGHSGDSCSGEYFSRNILTGEKRLQGFFWQGFGENETDAPGESLDRLAADHRAALETIARTLEDTLKEICRIGFVVEEGRVWLVEQRPADRKSVQADIALLLDLVNRGILDTARAIQSIDPLRLNEILHPVLDPASAADFTRWTGGIAGAPGAAVGKAYFSAGALLAARKQAPRGGEDPRFILVLPASFAEDVAAIEVSAGVLTAEGGYSAHASVVARQYGKTSLIAPGMKIQGKQAALGGISFSQGDYITLDVPPYGPASVYLGAGKLIQPDPGESGLPDVIALARGFIRDFHVRANAETPQDAALALALGAEGIGLCRTEHLFFGAERINLFREMLFADSPEAMREALNALKVMQIQDFLSLFTVMAGRAVTIRLLDAPLHEFLPHTEGEAEDFAAHLERTRKRKVSTAEVLARFEEMRECNPMLGRRGCRIAVSYPEIYAMQVQAVFEAAYKLREEGAAVCLEIMVPLVMSAPEFKLIAYGKTIEGAGYAGIADVEEALRAGKKAAPMPYRIGAMIELPAAALGAAGIAKYSRFFSFGTNDLTQTALGISRDDFAAVMPGYTRFDLIEGDPFSVLASPVRELIVLAVERGRLTRPDLVCGLCGEQGAHPAAVRFCMDAGLNYVSCSPYSAPIALLAAAQAALERAGAGA
ncbi:MAG: pyruvate, phosphate dikinase [Treponema sp.]|jgi:pyruvate,orthophosphate dikinase|nr:pyruvate, phosphate dikinase [Treponema sp.]